MSTKNNQNGQNGKGDAPRNCFSKEYLTNFDSINWRKNQEESLELPTSKNSKSVPENRVSRGR